MEQYNLSPNWFLSKSFIKFLKDSFDFDFERITYDDLKNIADWQVRKGVQAMKLHEGLIGNQQDFCENIAKQELLFQVKRNSPNDITLFLAAFVAEDILNYPDYETKDPKNSKHKNNNNSTSLDSLISKMFNRYNNS